MPGYHIILLPLPDAGGFPGAPLAAFAALNNTLLSTTCKRASGVVVPIPTFWPDTQLMLIKAEREKIKSFIK